MTLVNKQNGKGKCVAKENWKEKERVGSKKKEGEKGGPKETLSLKIRHRVLFRINSVNVKAPGKVIWGLSCLSHNRWFPFAGHWLLEQLSMTAEWSFQLRWMIKHKRIPTLWSVIAFFPLLWSWVPTTL